MGADRVRAPIAGGFKPFGSRRPEGFPASGGLKPFGRALWRPQGQEARTARAVALVYLLPFAVGLLSILRSSYSIPQVLLQVSRSLGIMAALAAFAVIYLNYLPETTSFMVRLVGVMLVTLLTVLAAVGWLITPTYAAQYHPALPDQRTLRFTPNAAGGYDVSLMPFHFESDLGANLHLLDRRAFEAWGSRRYEAQLNFAFPFYGKTYDRMYANEDGAIALGHDLVSYFSYSYHYGGDTPFIFPLLVDLNPEAGGSVFARQESDRLILTWERVPAWYHREDVYTFQAVLYTSGVFEFSYNGLPDKLAYLSDDEPSARAWVIGAVPGDMKISPLAPLPAASLSSKPVVACPGGQARGNLPAESPARTAQPGRAEKAPQGLVRAPAACPEPAEGGAFQLQTGGLQPLGLSWQWPQRIELAALTPEHVIRGGPEGLVQDYYLDFRRHLHTLLLPLAYLMLGVSLLMLLAFPWLFHLNLVKPLETLLAGVRRVNAGDLQTTMPVHYRDEIGFLTESFNRAAARLHDQVTTLETRVAERTADLTQVNARLRQEMDQREAAQAQVLAQQRAGRGA